METNRPEAAEVGPVGFSRRWLGWCGRLAVDQPFLAVPLLCGSGGLGWPSRSRTHERQLISSSLDTEQLSSCHEFDLVEALGECRVCHLQLVTQVRVPPEVASQLNLADQCDQGR